MSFLIKQREIQMVEKSETKHLFVFTPSVLNIQFFINAYDISICILCSCLRVLLCKIAYPIHHLKYCFQFEDICISERPRRMRHELWFDIRVMKGTIFV